MESRISFVELESKSGVRITYGAVREQLVPWVASRCCFLFFLLFWVACSLHFFQYWRFALLVVSFEY